MSDQIKKSDISEKDLFKYIIDGAKLAEKQLDAMNEQLRKTAQISKNTLKNTKVNDATGLKSVEKAQNDLNRAYNESLKIEKQKLILERQTITAKESLARATEKEVKNADALTNRYKIWNKEARDLKNESKRLGAELEHLAISGNKNTKEYRDLARQYKETTLQATTLDARLKKLDKNVGDNFRNVGNYSGAINKLKSGLSNLGISLGVGVAINEIKSFAKSSVDAFRESEQALGQVRAGLESTGNKAGFTVDELAKKASDLMKNSLFDDEQILQEVTSKLLIFTNVSGEVFDRAQQSAIDLAARMGGDLQGATIKLGKALNDPKNGFAALKKSGITFTDEQQKTIKTLQSTGNLLGAQNIILDEMNKKFGGSAKATAEADGGFIQLSHTIEEVKEKFGKIIVEGLKPTIKALKEFFDSLTEQDIKDFVSTIGTFVTVIGKLVSAYVAYKVTMIGVRTAQALMDKETRKSMFSFGKLDESVKKADGSLNDAKNSSNKFGNALSSIGWAVAIELAYELGNMLWDYASGAAEAEMKTKLLSESFDAGSVSAQKFLDKISKINGDKKLILDQQLAGINGYRKITKKQYDEELALMKRNQKIVVQNTIEKISLKLKEARENFKDIEKQLNNTSKFNPLNVFERAKLTVEFAEAAKSVGIFKGQLVELRKARNEDTKSTIKEQVAGSGNTKVIKKETEAMKNKRLELEAYVNRKKELDEAQNSAEIKNILGAMTPQEREEAELRTSYEKRLALVKEFSDERKSIETAMLNDLNDIRLKYAQQELDDEKIRLDNANQLYADYLNEQLQIKRDEAQKEHDKQVERLKTVQEYGTLIANYEIKQSEKRIALIDKEIEASQKQFDFLQTLASNGNINAQQSLAEQQKIINDANLKKIKEQKRIERIKLAETAFGVYEAKVEAGDKHPLLSTIKDVTLLTQFISSLPTFEKGTEDTGTNGRGVDGRGGFHAILHPNERVVDAENNVNMKGISNDELSKIALKYNTGQLIELKHTGAFAGNSLDLLPLLKEFKDIKNIIQNRPTTSVQAGEIVHGAFQIVERSQQGNVKKTTKFNIK